MMAKKRFIAKKGLLVTFYSLKIIDGAVSLQSRQTCFGLNFSAKFKTGIEIDQSQGIEIRYSAHSAFTFTSLLIFKNLSKIVLLRDEMPCR